MPTPASKEESQERAQLTRIHEANCHIAYPNPNDDKFRLAIQKKLSLAFGLPEMRKYEITGTATKPTATTTRGK